MEELKNLQYDLEALRELYGFLQCNADVPNNGITLSERSKFLLKNLLDGVTKKVMETHKKIIEAAERGVNGTSCSSESDKGRVLSEFYDQFYVSPDMLRGEPDVIRNFMKESNHTAFSSLKDEDSFNRLRSPEVVSQQSRPSFSMDKPESRKKCCQSMNGQSSRKQERMARTLSKDFKQQVEQCDPLAYVYQASWDERKSLKKYERSIELQKSSCLGLQGTASVANTFVGSSTSVASGDDFPNANQVEKEAVNDFSKDVDNVVKHIESHILALRLCTKLADAAKGTLPHGLCKMPTAVSPREQAEDHLVKFSELNNAVEPFSHRNELQLQDDLNEKHETATCRVHGLRIPTEQEDITKRPSMPLKMPHEIPRNNNEGKKFSPTLARPRSPKPYQPAGSKASVKPISMERSLADHENLPEHIKGSKGIFRNKILHHQKESEDSATTGGEESAPATSMESSTAGSEESNTARSNESETSRSDKSFTAGSGDYSNDSEAYSLPRQDSVASIAKRFDHGVYEEVNSSTTTISDYRDVSESSRSYPTRRTHKPAEGQRIGRLKRLKNKIDLIFHHHHHHHHGHHDNDDHQIPQTVHTRSTWTPLRNLFHQKNRHEGVDNRLRKARAANNGPIKHQVGHFHALVEGLLQHIRHSKESKHKKGGMKYLGNYQHGRKNRKVKQLHWWQMFQRQVRVKLPNRKRVKIRFMSKKQQLKVPKLR